ncbi:MAG: NAD+ synthase, partial [Proteobacteria bacterium]|nr:NAD+ synthase [Pseudomonadota bacterium]
NIAIGICFPRNHPNEPEKLHNSAAFIQNGVIKMIYDKQKLPNYLVFDEKRYFTPGSHDGIVKVEFNGIPTTLGISVCEDIWHEAEPVINQAKHKVDLLINISASPYASDKIGKRIKMLRERSKNSNIPLIYCNLVGGQDELIFDGTSCVIDANGDLLARCPTFKEDFRVIDFTDKKPMITPRLDKLAELYQALVMATHDYFAKNGFNKAVLGLSGGIDSALTAAIAVDALGHKNVTGLLMPSKYSSGHSVEDAQQLAKNLQIQTHLMNIEPIHQVFTDKLSSVLDDYHRNMTDENLQARIRGMLNMAYANNHKAILLCTSNKSETAVGYTTLYGDMAGGYAIIKDLFKMQVYELCHFRNQISTTIPKTTLNKPPSAELRVDQKDSDSLPDYAVLDTILKAYIHDFQDANLIVAKGYDLKLVKRILEMVDRNEYKRQQAAPGPRLTKMAFGKDRRMPISNGYSY